MSVENLRLVLAATIRGALGLQRQSDLRAHGTNEVQRLRTTAHSFIHRGWSCQRPTMWV